QSLHRIQLCLLVLSLVVSRLQLDLCGIEQLGYIGVGSEGGESLLRQVNRFTEFFTIDFYLDVPHALLDRALGLLFTEFGLRLFGGAEEFGISGEFAESALRGFRRLLPAAGAHQALNVCNNA